MIYKAKKIRELMIPVHTHAEIENDANPEGIVYREKDVKRIMKEYGKMLIGIAAQHPSVKKDGRKLFREEMYKQIRW